MAQTDDPEEIRERVEDTIADGRPEEALRLAEAALRKNPDAAVLHAVAAWARWELGDLAGAAGGFAKALELEPGTAEWLSALAEVRFGLMQFAEARRLAMEVLAIDEDAEVLELLSRLAEREGDYEEADRLMWRAHALDPQEISLPYRLSEDEFRRCAEEALARLPDEFQRAMRQNLTLLLEPLPSEDLLTGQDPPIDPTLLGLYAGIPLTDREPSRLSGTLPGHIYLFQKNIERVASDREGLLQEIAVTLYHEVGHFLGFDEDELEELDLD